MSRMGIPSPATTCRPSRASTLMTSGARRFSDKPLGVPADYRHDLRLADRREAQRGQLLLRQPQLIVRHESPWTNHAQGHLRLLQALQPPQGRILGVGQHDPTAAAAQADQPLVEQQDVARLRLERAKPRCRDFHVNLAHCS